jgi:hypothetical protein
MKHQSFLRVVIVTCIVLVGAGCGGSDNALAPIAASGLDSGVQAVTQVLTLSVEQDLNVGDQVEVELQLLEDDQAVFFDLEAVTVIIGQPEILRVNANSPNVLEAMAPGETTIQYVLGTLESNEVTVTIESSAVTVVSLRIETQSTEAQIGQSLQLTAIGADDSNQDVDLSTQVTWASSNQDVATVSDSGEVEILAQGRSEISATFEMLASQIRVGSACQYPSYDRRIALNSTFPPLAWNDAHNALGEIAPYSMRELFCDPDNAPSTVAVIVGAGWCSACTTLTVNIVNPNISALTAANMQVLYIEAEDGQYNPATSVFAYRHLNRLIDDSPGIRVGDKNTAMNEDAGPWSPEDEFIGTHSDGSFPSAWVVRTSDMKVIADQNTSEYWLPFLLIAQDPNADWSEPPPPPPPPFDSICGEGDDETSEPNDTSLRAARLNEGVQSGGICTPAPDFYRIQTTGSWRVTLEFSHDVGDLDMYLWDKEANDVMQDDAGAPIASNGEGDIEMLESQGNGIISIVGYGGASNVYNLTLELLE